MRGTEGDRESIPCTLTRNKHKRTPSKFSHLSRYIVINKNGAKEVLLRSTREEVRREKRSTRDSRKMTSPIGKINLKN